MNWFRWWRASFERRKAMKRMKEYQRGYAFAVNQLEWDISAPAMLESRISAAKDFGAYTSYDDGIRDALRNHEAQKR